MTDKPADFNWVAVRLQCSLPQVFESLRLQVKTDVETRSAAQPESDRHYAFKFSSADRRFSAAVIGHKIHRVVVFNLEGSVISVRDENDDEILLATATLNDEGECRLKVGNQERELWQVRKMALETLLFGDY
jgi:hypothetical protein